MKEYQYQDLQAENTILREKLRALDAALRELAEEWRTGEDWQGVDDAAAPHCAKGLDALRVRLLTITPDRS